MTDTIISSATKEVILGFDRPFLIIGERINPTGRKLLPTVIRARRPAVVVDAVDGDAGQQKPNNLSPGLNPGSIFV